MGKYKFAGNKKLKHYRTKKHPAIDLGTNDGVWKNIEVTTSPTQKGRYERFDVNPDPNEKCKISYFRKYIRHDDPKFKTNEYEIIH